MGEIMNLIEELNSKIDALVKQNEELKAENTELKAQLEEMKHCSSCVNCSECMQNMFEGLPPFANCKNLDKWEFNNGRNKNSK